LLTSRPGEYLDVAGTDALTAAAAIRLTDLIVSDLGNYLPRTHIRVQRCDRVGSGPERVARPPARPAGVNLRAVLTTPLMVGLARAIYSDPAGRDPAELLETDRFASQYDLEDHLLGSFIPRSTPTSTRAGIPSACAVGSGTLRSTWTGSTPMIWPGGSWAT